MLRTIVLALHHDVGWQVSNTYGGFGFVDVLTARTRGAVHVDTQIRRVDFDIDIVVDFRVDEHRAERGVATAAGVERALAHRR